MTGPTGRGTQDEQQVPTEEGIRLARLTELLLGHSPAYTYPELAEAAGVEAETAVQLWQALGLATPGPEAVMFTDADVEALRVVVLMLRRGVGLRDQLGAARAWGQAMARIAEWQVEMVRELAGPGTDGPARASASDRVLSLGAEVLPDVDRFQQYVWRRHLVAAADRLLSDTTGQTSGRSLVVGFADIVGFTDISRGLTEARLAEFIEAFEARSAAIVTRNDGRVIKTIGDEIMFVSEQPAAAAETALQLSELTSILDGRPHLHIGLARGHVLHHLGDVHGPVVNLASRLTSLARPGTVLVDPALADALAPVSGGGRRYRLRRLRPVAMRGFPQVQPWLLRRAWPVAHRAADEGLRPAGPDSG